MTAEIYAYLAGAMDSDGSFGIRRSTYAMRVRKDANQPVYSERASLKQVTPEIPVLLRDTFGGSLRLNKGGTENSRPLSGWDATDTVAANAARLLLPYLRVKKRQAELLIALRETKDNDRYKQFAYWFEQEHPDWRSMPMVTFSEATALLGYSHRGNITQAVANGSLLALPWQNNGGQDPRIPRDLVLAYKEHASKSKDGRGRMRPKQLIALREQIWEQCRLLNRIGTGKHPISERTGIYAPK